MTEKTEEKTLKDVLRVIFSHYKLFLVATAAFMIAVLAGSRYVPVKYTAVAMFERRGDSAAEAIGSNANESFQILRLTLQQELAGAKAVGRVVDELGLLKTPAGRAVEQAESEAFSVRQDLINAILKNLAIDWKVRTDEVDLVAVTFNSSDPKLAEMIPNALVRNYIAYAGESILRRLHDSRAFLKTQVRASSQRLAELNNKKIEFESKYADLLLDGKTNLQDRIQEIYADIETLRRQQSIATQKCSQIKTLIRSVRIKALRDQLALLKNEVDSSLTLAGMTAEHPRVQTLQAKIRQVENRIRDNRDADGLSWDSAGKDGMDTGMALQLATAQSEAQIITDEIERLQKRVVTYKAVMGQAIPLREEYLAITKPLEDQQTSTRRWQQRLTDVEMTISAEEAKRRTQLNTVQTAQKPTQPSFPPFWAIIAVAVGGGLLFGYGCAFIGGSLDHTFHRPQDASKALGVPVLGAISEIETVRQRRLRQVRQTVVTLTVALVVLVSLGVSTYGVVVRLGYPDRAESWKVPTTARAFSAGAWNS